MTGYEKTAGSHGESATDGAAQATDPTVGRLVRGLRRTMSWPAPTGEPAGSGTPAHSGSTPQVATGPPPAAPASGSRAINTWPSPTSSPEGSEVNPAPTGVIATAPPSDPAGVARINERTGQPLRPWTIWVSAVALFSSAAAVTVGLLLAMWAMATPWAPRDDGRWNPDDKFNMATWLTTQFPYPPAHGMRVFFAILCCVIAVLVAGVSSTVGYYAFAGYHWTRIGGVVAVVVSALSLLLTPIAAISIGLAALGAIALWLPPSGRFFDHWRRRRHPQQVYSEPVGHVFYGPLPRYR